jgi:hypothetical protein
MTRIMGTLHEDVFTFMVISRSILLIKRNVSDKTVDKVKTNFIFNPKIVPFVR